MLLTVSILSLIILFFFLGAEDYDNEIYHLSNNHASYSCNSYNFEIEEFCIFVLQSMKVSKYRAWIIKNNLLTLGIYPKQFN